MPIAAAPVKKDTKNKQQKNKPQNITLPKSYKKEEEKTEMAETSAEENTQNDSEKKIDEE